MEILEEVKFKRECDPQNMNLGSHMTSCYMTSCFWQLVQALAPTTYEPRHEKTNNLHMRKQRRRSASR